MDIPSAVFHHVVFTEMPANADPLLFPADVAAYSTSDNPWEPEFSIVARSPGRAIASAVTTRTNVGVVRM